MSYVSTKEVLFVDCNEVDQLCCKHDLWDTWKIELSTINYDSKQPFGTKTRNDRTVPGFILVGIFRQNIIRKSQKQQKHVFMNIY